MSSQWKVVFPAEGYWFDCVSLMDAGKIVLYANENYKKTTIVVFTRVNDDTRKWRLSSLERIQTLYMFMRNNCGTGNLKLRVKQKKRHGNRLP